MSDNPQQPVPPGEGDVPPPPGQQPYVPPPQEPPAGGYGGGYGPPGGDGYGAPPSTGGYGGPPGAPGGFDADRFGRDLSNDATGLFGSLFDFSFTNYVTPKIVRIVYVIGIVLIAFTWFVLMISAFTQSIWLGLFALVIGPIFALLYLIMFRIILEFYVAIVQTAETIQKYAHRDGIR